MRSFKTEGIIIKRRNVGEADRILTVFTKKNGKIYIKAIGTRRTTSRRASHIELLNISLLTLYKGRTLPILTEAQTIENFSDIKNNLVKIGFAYHLCELIDGLCPENQENNEVFSLFINTLHRLSYGEDVVSVIHEFEIELLTNLGFYNSSLVNNPDTTTFIERILERKLKARLILPRFN